MDQYFVESRRGQGFLLPPDVREWLAPDHLAWFVIEAVAEMDLSASMSPIGPMVMAARLMAVGDRGADPVRAFANNSAARHSAETPAARAKR